ncbi:MAG: YncE family protein [Candidatus Bathyarchaeota archaeon]|nr:YncE family protein [Candidatus Bathyarchaeota archaeon]
MMRWFFHGWGAFRRRSLILLVVILIYIGVYLAFEYGDFETSREMSHLVMPVTTQYTSPVSKPTGLAIDGASLWVSSANEGAVLMIESSTGMPLRSLDLDIDDPWGMTWDGEYLWVTDFDTRYIYRIDTETNEIVSRVKVPGISPTGLAWDGKNLVLCDFDAHAVFYLDPVSGAVVRQFSMPSPGYNPSGVAWDGENIWVADISASYVFKLNPLNGSVISYYYSSGYYPSDLAWDNGSLWSLDYSTSMIYKTEPGERAVEITKRELPSWFGLAFILTVTPILMSLMTALKEPPHKVDATIEKDDRFKTLSAVLHLTAIMGSIYTGYELFRIIYNVVYVNKIVFRGQSPLWIFEFEMLLCLYTMVYWVIFTLYKVVQYWRKRS